MGVLYKAQPEDEQKQVEYIVFSRQCINDTWGNPYYFDDFQTAKGYAERIAKEEGLYTIVYKIELPL